MANDNSRSSSPPWGLKWRSKPAFIISTIALGLFVDLFLYGLVIPVIPFMLQERINVPKSMVQTYTSGMLAVYAASSAVFSIAVGVLADKTSKRQGPYLCGLVALAAATVMLALGKSLAVLFIARLLQGLSAAVVWTVGLAVVLDTVGPSNLGKVMGTIFSIISLGNVLAPVLGGILYDKTGYIGVFGLGLSLVFLDVILRLLMIERKVAAKYDNLVEDQATNPRDFDTRSAHDEDAENGSEDDALLRKDDNEKYKIPEGQNRIVRSAPILYCFRHPGFVMGLTLMFMQALVLGSFEATIPTEAADLFGFGSLESGLLFIALDIPVLLLGFVGGWIVDKYGTKPATMIGYGLIIPPLLLLRLPSAEILHGKDNIILYCAILFLAGMGTAMITSPGTVEATDVVQRYDKANPQFFGDNGPYAQLYGFNSLMYSTGLSVGPELAGVLKDHIGYGNMNTVLAGIAAIIATLSFFFVGGTVRVNIKRVQRRFADVFDAYSGYVGDLKQLDIEQNYKHLQDYANDRPSNGELSGTSLLFASMLTTLSSVVRNMAEYFDPSPRASKRRKTVTYKTVKPITSHGEKQHSTNAADDKSLDRTMGLQEEFDSAYGSKEESLLEDKLVDGERAEESGSITQSDRNLEKRGSIEVPASKYLRHGRATRSEKPQDCAAESAQEIYQQTTTEQPRSSGRQRKRPRRYSMSPEKPKHTPRLKIQKGSDIVKLTQNLEEVLKEKKELVGATTPKGILTPSRKQKRNGSRKSVVFDQEGERLGEQLGFKEIDNFSTQKSSTSKQQPHEVHSGEVEKGFLPRLAHSTHDLQLSSVLPSEYRLAAEADTDSEETVFENINTTFLAIDQDVTEENGLSVDEEPEILTIKASVLTRLILHKDTPVSSHLQTQYESLCSLLRATVVSGESNSLLLLGTRGAGKSHLLEASVSRLHREHADDFHVVRLNGFYQTDDRVALREIWRQLGREMQVDETELGETGGSYADTMTSLLSLLSHPDEFSEHVSDDNQAMDIDSRATRTSKSIVFILDEFDLFTNHPRQTLLYNLFDIAQSKKAPIAVIGCSARMDVVDCLEKRVKSRFSHRWLHIPLVKSLSDIEKIVESALCVGKQDAVTDIKLSRKASEAKDRWNEHVRTSLLVSPHVKGLIQRIFYTTKSIPDLYSALFTTIATVQLPTSEHRITNSKHDACTARLPTMLSLLPELPTLHLALLVASSRLDAIHNLTTLNFNLVYAHYQELISRSKLQVTASGAMAVGGSLRQWNPGTARSAWEDLGLYGCIVQASGVNTGTSAGSGGRDGASATGEGAGGEGANVRMWRVDVTLEELDWAVKRKWNESGGVRDILSKWCREI